VRRLLLILLAALAAALLVAVARLDNAGWTNLVRLDVSPDAVRILALAVAALIALAMLRGRFSRLLASAVIWAVIALVLVVGYAYRFELRDVADRVLIEFIPGQAATKGRTVQIARAGGGGFSVAAQINGARVSMVLDTGASAVVLTPEAAKAAGLPLEVLGYSINVETANGRARAAPVTLDRISVGGITERSVPALIAQPGQLRVSLLGMSFLNRLESWEVRGDRLLLRGYP
jgi:aspartyl protease family protein